MVTPNSRAAIQVQLIGWLLETEPPLRSIIVVEPWPLPDERETYDENLDWMRVVDNWDPTFAESPTELDLSTLTSAIDRGEREGDYRLAYGLSADEYLARVDKLTDRLLRESPPFGRSVQVIMGTG